MDHSGAQSGAQLQYTQASDARSDDIDHDDAQHDQVQGQSSHSSGMQSGEAHRAEEEGIDSHQHRSGSRYDDSNTTPDVAEYLGEARPGFIPGPHDRERDGIYHEHVNTIPGIHHVPEVMYLHYRIGTVNITLEHSTFPEINGILEQLRGEPELSNEDKCIEGEMALFDPLCSVILPRTSEGIVPERGKKLTLIDLPTELLETITKELLATDVPVHHADKEVYANVAYLLRYLWSPWPRPHLQLEGPLMKMIVDSADRTHTSLSFLQQAESFWWRAIPFRHRIQAQKRQLDGLGLVTKRMYAVVESVWCKWTKDEAKPLEQEKKDLQVEIDSAAADVADYISRGYSDYEVHCATIDQTMLEVSWAKVDNLVEFLQGTRREEVKAESTVKGKERKIESQ